MSAQQRSPVELPGRVDPEHVDDGGDDVRHARAPIVHTSSPLLRELDEERYGRDVADVRLVDGPLVDAGPDRDAFVGGDDEERTVPESGRAQPANDPAELAVGEADLKQMSPVRLVGDARIVHPSLAHEAFGETRRVIGATRREIPPRRVRQDHVQDVELRLRSGPERGEEAVHLGGRIAPGGDVHARPSGEEGRLDLGDQAPHPCAERFPRASAETGGTEAAQRLEGMDAIPAAEQREEVPRVVREERQLIVPRALSGEDRGDGPRGVVVVGRRASVPRRRPGERGEVGRANGVDASVRRHQRALGELVEDHEDDGGSQRLMQRRSPHVRGRQLLDRRVDEEDGEEEDGAERGDGEKRPRGLPASVGRRKHTGRGKRHQNLHESRRALQSAPDGQEREHRDERLVDDDEQPRVNEPGGGLHDQEDRRRHEQHDDAVDDDVERVEPLHCEVVRILREHAEDRLADGERREGQEVNGAHPRGRYGESAAGHPTDEATHSPEYREPPATPPPRIG